MELEDAFFETSDYELTNTKLGEGQFGEVFLVKNIDDDKLYAAKIINVQCNYSGKEQLRLIRETAILHSLDHPAIVKFYGVNFHAFDDPSQLSPTILTEYLAKGSFKEVLKKAEHGLADHEWNATKKHICLLGIADAMRYLHSHGVLHRDLKPENILIDGDYRPRIADFGMSRCFSKALSRSMQLSMTGKIGTPLYMSPELFEDEEHFSPGVDVYAFGIMAYEIASGQEPYSENGKSITLTNLVRKVLNGKRPDFVEGITEPMWELITRCWSKDPKERPSFDEIFDELSTNFSLLDEDVDEEEINEYIKYLGDKRNEKTAVSEEKDDFRFEYDQLVKKQENDKKIYSDMLKILIGKHSGIGDLYFDSVKGNILHLACKAGNIELVKYLISLNKIDLASKSIFIYFLIPFHFG
ncbi:hypothetical protein M9Y10_042922 [Tritrichomonas musculus]|uniref:Protein kinase domain-containing protein n=1 Tax=Tritrichomonas musculus TaxID=1915356 RepID=A0ABR2JYB6_9EUKA